MVIRLNQIFYSKSKYVIFWLVFIRELVTKGNAVHKRTFLKYIIGSVSRSNQIAQELVLEKRKN